MLSEVHFYGIMLNGEVEFEPGVAFNTDLQAASQHLARDLIKANAERIVNKLDIKQKFELFNANPEEIRFD